MFDRIVTVYRRTRRYSTLTESPKDRVFSLAVHLLASNELPIIMLGISIGTTIEGYAGGVPSAGVAASWILFVLALLIYVVSKEVIYAARAAREEFGDDPIGIH